MKALKNIVSSSYEALKDEIFNSRKLKKDEADKLCKMFGLAEFNGFVYVNNFNIILTHEADNDAMKYLLKDKVLEISIPEYGNGIYIYRKFNDPLLESIWEINFPILK